MQKGIADTTVTVVVPNHRELRVGTLLSVIEQSKLGRRLFEV
jgi:predicted RNA binding protein YcfA (HicA-like mRNA interferase family)